VVFICAEDCRDLAVLSSTLPMRACDFSVFFNRGNRGPGVLTRMVKCDALFSGFSGIPRVPERLSDGVHNYRRIDCKKISAVYVRSRPEALSVKDALPQTWLFGLPK